MSLNTNTNLTDKEYEKFLWDLLQSAKKVDGNRKEYRRLEETKRDVHGKITGFLKNALDSEQMGYEYSDLEGRKFRYNVNFRIPVSTTGNNRYKRLGFFFDAAHGWSNFRVKDYSRCYHSDTTGPDGIFLIIDYAEEIIDKARDRMKLTKYKSKYNLSPLIDVLHTLSVLRGNTYFIREGTPPKKFSAKVAVDPVTGKKLKIRASSVFKAPFKIKKVTINSEE